MNTVLGDAIVGAVKKAFSLLPSEATLDEWEASLEKSFSGFILGLDAKIHQWSAGLFKDLGLPSFDAVIAAFENLMADIGARISKWWKGLFADFKLPSIFGGGDEEKKEDLGIAKGAETETQQAGATVKDGMAKTAQTVKQGFDAAWNATRDFAVTQFNSAAVTIQGIFAGIVSGIETQVGNLVLGAQRMAQPGMVPAFAGVRAQQAGGRGGNTTINQNNRINVDARGGDPAKVQRGVERGIDPGRVTRASQSGTVPKG